MSDTSGWWTIGGQVISGGLGLAGIIYGAWQKRSSDQRLAQATEKVGDSTSVAGAFATSQGQVKFWADKYGEISEKYGAVLASQSAQASQIESLREQVETLTKKLGNVGDLLGECEKAKAAAIERALKAEDECSNWKAAFDSMVLMTQMAEENRADDGIMNVAEERIRRVLSDGERKAFQK